MTAADRAAARLLALDMEQVANRLRSGQVPGWAVTSIASQWWTLRKLLLGVNPEHTCGARCGMEDER